MNIIRTVLGPWPAHDRDPFSAKQLTDVGNGWCMPIALLRRNKPSIEVECEPFLPARYETQRVDARVIHCKESPGEREGRTFVAILNAVVDAERDREHHSPMVTTMSSPTISIG